MRMIPDCLNIINQLPTILTWSVFTFLLSVFLEFCMREKMIFGFWLDFLANHWLTAHNPEKLMESRSLTDEQVMLKTGGKYDTQREYKFSHVKWFWFKPMGACVVCMNVWISLAFFWTQESLIGVLAMIILSNFLVRFFNEKL